MGDREADDYSLDDDEASTDSDFGYMDALAQSVTRLAISRVSSAAPMDADEGGIGDLEAADNDLRDSWFVRVDPVTGVVFYENEGTSETSYVEPERLAEQQDFAEQDLQEEKIKALVGYGDAPGKAENPHFRTDEIILARQNLKQWIARENVAPPDFVKDIKLRW